MIPNAHWLGNEYVLLYMLYAFCTRGFGTQLVEVAFYAAFGK